MLFYKTIECWTSTHWGTSMSSSSSSGNSNCELPWKESLEYKLYILHNIHEKSDTSTIMEINWFWCGERIWLLDHGMSEKWYSVLSYGGWWWKGGLHWMVARISKFDCSGRHQNELLQCPNVQYPQRLTTINISMGNRNITPGFKVRPPFLYQWFSL